MKRLTVVLFASLMLLIIGPGIVAAAPIFSDTFEGRTTASLSPDYTVLQGDVQVVNTTQKDGLLGNTLRLYDAGNRSTVELAGF